MGVDTSGVLFPHPLEGPPRVAHSQLVDRVVSRDFGVLFFDRWEIEGPLDSWRDAKMVLDNWPLGARRQPRRLTEPSSSFTDISSRAHYCLQTYRQARR